MTIASKLEVIDNSLASIKSAIIAKGQTPSGNITTYATAIGNITSSSVISSLSITPTTSAQTITAPSGTDGYNPISVSAVTSSIDNNIVAGNIKKDVTILGVTGTYEGSGGGTPTFSIEVPLTRFKDDNNNQIGTHYMNFVDANGNAYKVILLDAQYRKASAQWCSNTTAVTNLPNYGAVKDTNPWEAKETATTNTQLILNFCSSNGYTSSACTHCRSKSFVIGGVTYYGQLPSGVEVLYLARHYNEFDSYDTSASSQTSLNFSSTSRTIWSSTQINGTTGVRLNSGGALNSTNKTSNFFACPVLEIPF